MRPGAAVIEIAFPGTDVMGFPASYYYPVRNHYHK
jgi:hypothetical protein